MPASCGAIRRALLLSVFLLAVLAAFALAQPGKSTPFRPRFVRAHAGRQQAGGKQPELRFGDVTLHHFSNVDWKIGEMAKATGPDTTLDAFDPKQSLRTQIKAASMTAWTDPKRRSQVARVEADENVRFSSTRPAPKGGDQKIHGTGRRAVYQKQAGTLVVEGPVDFHAEQPAPDGKTTQSVDGTANRVTYDENKRILTFSGDVNGTVLVPDVAEGPQPFSGDEVRIEMAEQPYRVNIANPSLRGKVELHPKPGAKPGK